MCDRKFLLEHRPHGPSVGKGRGSSVLFAASPHGCSSQLRSEDSERPSSCIVPVFASLLLHSESSFGPRAVATQE